MVLPSPERFVYLLRFIEEASHGCCLSTAERELGLPPGKALVQNRPSQGSANGV